MKQKIDFYLGGFLSILLGIMLFSVLWQVLSRYLLNEPSSFTEELARYLLIWIGTLGAAYASGQRMHLAITYLPDKLSDKHRDRLQIVLNVLVILFVIAVFCVGGIRLVYITSILGQNSPALGVPLAFVYAILPVSGALILIYKGMEVTKLAGRQNDS